MRQDRQLHADQPGHGDGASRPSGQGRVFLFLQGPHGPFFDRLAGLLRASGAEVWRCAFNAGDEFFWSDPAHLLRHDGTLHDWPSRLDQIIAQKGVTDIVLYGDVRPIHAVARAAAEEDGLRLHVFEEGYLRPYWITYERGGSNGHSPLMRISLDQMRAALRDTSAEIHRPPARWGDMRQHKFYGALYHFLVMARRRAYPGFRSHRDLGIAQEFRLNLSRLLMMPAHQLQSRWRWRRIQQTGAPYSLVLLQLQHDSSFQRHSPFRSNAAFIRAVMAAFARSAPGHHQLIFKAHPLEDGRAGNSLAIRQAAQEYGLSGRVHYLRGCKLAMLLSQARSVITVNSTGAQQALWRGLPVRALGRAVYDKPGLVSHQPLDEFLADPRPPDPKAYRTLRDYLLQTSQIPGGFYARHSRGHALRVVSDLMLAPVDTYQLLSQGRRSLRQQITDEA